MPRRRILALLALLALALSGCDKSGGSATDSKSPNDPASLVGSWKMPSGEFATQYFVFRADGTGKALSVAGTRRAISDFTWRLQGDSLELSKAGQSSKVSIEFRGDTLALFSPTVFGTSETDFTKTPEPDLTPADGDRPAQMVGHWSRLVPSVSEHSRGDSTWEDTTWNPELVNLSSDGLAEVVDFETGADCDEEGNCKTLTVPMDTIRYRWWTSSSDLYLQIRSITLVSDPEMSQDAGENGAVQVVSWRSSSDSLHLQAKFAPYATQDYARVR